MFHGIDSAMDGQALCHRKSPCGRHHSHALLLQVDIHELLACFRPNFARFLEPVPGERFFVSDRRGEYEGQFWQSAKAPSSVASFQPEAIPAQARRASPNPHCPIPFAHVACPQATSKYDCYDGLDMWRQLGHEFDACKTIALILLPQV